MPAPVLRGSVFGLSDISGDDFYVMKNLKYVLSVGLAAATLAVVLTYALGEHEPCVSGPHNWTSSWASSFRAWRNKRHQNGKGE